MLDAATDPDRLKKLSQSVKDMRPDGTQSIPNLYVASSDATKGVKYLQTSQLKNELRGVWSDLEKEFDADPTLLIGAESEEAEEDAAQLEALNEFRKWTNSDGQEIEASIESLDETTVTFILRNGSKVPYAISKLSAESQAVLEGLR